MCGRLVVRNNNKHKRKTRGAEQPLFAGAGVPGGSQSPGGQPPRDGVARGASPWTPLSTGSLPGGPPAGKQRCKAQVPTQTCPPSSHQRLGGHAGTGLPRLRTAAPFSEAGALPPPAAGSPRAPLRGTSGPGGASAARPSHSRGPRPSLPQPCAGRRGEDRGAPQAGALPAFRGQGPPRRQRGSAGGEAGLAWGGGAAGGAAGAQGGCGRPRGRRSCRSGQKDSF